MLVVFDCEINDTERNDCVGIQWPVPECEGDRAEGEIVRTDKICCNRPKFLKAVDDRPVREHYGRGWQCFLLCIGQVVGFELINDQFKQLVQGIRSCVTELITRWLKSRTLNLGGVERREGGRCDLGWGLDDGCT